MQNPHDITSATRLNALTLVHNSKKYTAYRSADGVYFLLDKKGAYVKLVKVVFQADTFGVIEYYTRTSGALKGRETGRSLGYVLLTDAGIVNPAPITFGSFDNPSKLP